ncbi:hypothetical protein IID62_03600 [candidate division KSB1 bacterium]|nr:hypothetical protein [candidate division KSB1 bacterium]
MIHTGGMTTVRGLQIYKTLRKFIVRTFLGFLVLASFILETTHAQTVPEISPVEFSRMVKSMSEAGGYFSSDNWVTNETTYLDAIKPLERLNIKGGVYIGVASNQNFSYIAVIKPELVFFVDIRHLNRMQHLVYKVLFELAETRAEFFSLLFSKPLNSKNLPDERSDIDTLVEYFLRAPSNRGMNLETFEKVVSVLDNKYKYELEDTEENEIKLVLDAFYRHNLMITYSGGSNYRFPTLGQLLRTTDFSGEQLNIFNSREKYQFIRKMHLENKIIPLTGNFAGRKALTEVADFLDKHNLKVSAYYVSNVERYLFRDGIFSEWVDNINKLPITDKTVFIRWTHNSNYLYSQMTRLQLISAFLNNYDAGKYFVYQDLINSEYIK